MGMMTRSSGISLTGLALCLLVVGCGQSTEPAPAPVAAVELAAPEVETAGETSDAEVAAPDVEVADPEAPPAADPSQVTPTAEETAPAEVAAYQPPFPDRVDLFVPPARQGGAANSQDETQEAVSLLGFIRLDRQQAVLSINGEVWPVEEGGSQHGVEVISIQPPSVVLQRGRQRWQASLNN